MDRGAYRSIHTVLIDGPDFQALPPNAKLVFLFAKLNLGPTGIDVLYPDVLREQTGLTSKQVQQSLEILDKRGWIRQERNLIWIVEGLRFEPSRKLTNDNHLKDIAAHLLSLPRLAIVDAFRAHYGIPSPMPSPIPPEGHGVLRKTEDGERKTEKRKERSAPPGATGVESGEPKPAKPAPPEKPPSWVAEGVAWWTGNVGATTHPRFGKALTAAVGVHGWPDVFTALQCYVTECKAKDRPPKPEWLAAEIVLWIEKAKAPPTQDDVLTPAAKRALGIVA